MRRTIIDGHYEIVRKLGAGAVGEVYQVFDLRNKETLALKFLSKKTPLDTIEHFKREFRMLRDLHHPNLCAVYDFGTSKDGRHFYTMEYVDGKNIFEASRRLTNQEIYSLIIQLCRVLEYIHSRGLIHYDIKPGNVLIGRADEKSMVVKLMDFGLAGGQRRWAGTVIKGTLPYIAPELISGSAVDHRADLYSLGVVIYEIFTRKRLTFDRATNFAARLEQQRSWLARVPSQIVEDPPRKLSQLIMRLLAVEPASRFARANEVIKNINRFSQKQYALETAQTIEGYLLGSRLVGREREMALLISAYERMVHGAGSCGFITGDPGVGKSRLLKEFKVYIQLQHGQCFTGFAYKDKAKILEPFHDIFKELVHHIVEGFRQAQPASFKLSLAILFKIFPDLKIPRLVRGLPKIVPLDVGQERLRIFEALSALLYYCASRFGGIVLLFEDIHWADDLSLQLLEYLGRNIGNEPIVICATLRKEGLPDRSILRDVIKNLSGEDNFIPIGVKPLNLKDLAALLDSIVTSTASSPGLVKYLMDKTDGNPFFVEEIMRILLNRKGVKFGERIDVGHFRKISIPKTIEDIVLKRIKDLDRYSREIVRYGTVLPKGFSYNLMKRLTGLGDTELTKALWELKRRQIVIEEGDRFQFYHTTLRDALGKRLSNRDKKNLHYRVGNVLEAVNRRRLEPVIEDIAYHFINAGDRRKGVLYGLQSARKSSHAFVNEQAIQYYQSVLKLMGDEKPLLRYRVLNELSYTETRADQYDNAIKHYHEALSLRIGTTAENIKIHLGIGDIHAKKGNQNNALLAYRKAAGLVKKLKPGAERDLLRTNTNIKLCRVYLIKGDFKHAAKFRFDRLDSLKRIKGEEAVRLLIDIYNTMGAVEIHKGIRSKIDYDKAIQCYNNAYETSRRIGAEDKVAAALSNLGICYYYKYDYGEAYRCYERAVRLCGQVGDQIGVSSKLLNLGTILRDKGNYRRAIECFERVLVIAQRIRNPSVIGGALLRLGTCFVEQCDYKRAEGYYREALKIFESIDWKGEKGFLVRGLGIISQSMGDYTKALKFYKKALMIFTKIRHRRKIATLFIDIGSVLMEIGEVSKAMGYIDDALRLITALNLSDLEIDYHILLCSIGLIGQDYRAAGEFYRKGMELARRLGTGLQILKLSILRSELCYQTKRYGQGIKTVDRSVKMAAEMGIRDLHAEALLNQAKYGMEHGALSKIGIIKVLNEAKRIAEEVDNPAILWKTYFEFGRFFQRIKEHHQSLSYYRRCNEIFVAVGSKMRNESQRVSYLDRPDRRLVFSATNEIEKVLN